MFNNYTQMPAPRTNPMSSIIGNQQMINPNAGWNHSSIPMCPDVGSSSFGFQNNNSDFKNQSSQGSWNNQEGQGSWNNQTTQGTWNNQANRGSWNMGNYGGQMIRGPPPCGGRPMRGRGFGGSSRFSGPASGDHYCDSCERGFDTPEDLMNHRKNDHVICGLEGCTLSAHPKIVEKHQRMQHDSGLYSRLAAAASQNPDDVQKWIKERKKNYPTKENIERRKQEAEECLQRGEALGMQPESRFGRYRGRGGHNFRGRGLSWQKNGSRGGRGFGRGMHKRKFDGRGGRHQRQTKGRRAKKMLPERGPGYVEDDDPRDVPMFPGTASLLGVALEETSSSDEEMWDVKGSFSDAEWMGEGEERTSSVVAEKDNRENDSETKKGMEVVSNVIPLNNALGALMGMYASDDSDEDAPPVVIKTRVTEGDGPSSVEPKAEERAVDQNPPQSERQSMPVKSTVLKEGAKQDEGEESDGSAPEEVPIVKVEEGKGCGDGVEGQGEALADRGGGKEEGEGVGEGVKRTKRSRKRTRGHKGRSEVAMDKGEDSPKEKSLVSDVKKPVERMEYMRPPRHPTLLEELLKNEIRHERNVILQCIRHIVQSNFFDPVPVVQLEEENSTTNDEKSLPMADDSSTADVAVSI